jgi:starvation-inducible DNA-binding protein
VVKEVVVDHVMKKRFAVTGALSSVRKQKNNQRKQMSCQTKLLTLHSDNFVAAFKAHTYHFNITGPNFPQYHLLFKEVYETLDDQYDILGEQLRILGEKTPTSIREILDESNFKDNHNQTVSAMLPTLADTLEQLILCADILYAEAGSEGKSALETVIGDYSSAVSLLLYKVKSTL